MLGSIITNATDVVALVLLFGASIFIHEFGHFYAAIKLGLVVDVFSIGFGPALWKRTFRGVVYKICVFPLGGYVALPQLDPAGMEKIQGEQEDDGEVEQVRELPEVAPWKRIVVSVAGPLGNVLFAIVLALVIYWSPGAITYKGAPVVDAVELGSAAELAGLQAGDEIYRVNGKRVDTWYAFGMEAFLNGTEEPLELEVRSGRERRILQAPVVKRADGLPGIEGLVPRSIPCVLRDVDPGGMAGVAGLLPGDIVQRVGDMDIRSSDDFLPAVEAHLGGVVPVEVVRGSDQLVVQVEPLRSPVSVVQLIEGRVGHAAGLEVGDRLVALDGAPVTSDVAFMESLYRQLGAVLPLEVERNGKRMTLTLSMAPAACLFEAVTEKSPAAEAGLWVGDQVVSVDGEPVRYPSEFAELVSGSGGKPLQLKILRGETVLEVEVTPTFDKKRDRLLIGVMLGGPVGVGLANDPLGIKVADIVMPWMQEKEPLQQLRSDAMGIVRLLGALVDRREARHAAGGLGGPVAIIATLWVAIKLGFLNAVGFLRFLNVNLAMLNLLPIPVLDGGHIIFATWEWVTRRKVHPRVVAILVNAFAILLIGAFLFLTVRDVSNLSRLFGRNP
jgi:regulator of sigma E protease